MADLAANKEGLEDRAEGVGAREGKVEAAAEAEDMEELAPTAKEVGTLAREKAAVEDSAASKGAKAAVEVAKEETVDWVGREEAVTEAATAVGAVDWATEEAVSATVAAAEAAVLEVATDEKEVGTE